MKDVHTEHCCIVHGCKYSDEKCTVTTRRLKQSHGCENCELFPFDVREEFNGNLVIDGVKYRYKGHYRDWSPLFPFVQPEGTVWCVEIHNLPYVQRWAAGLGKTKKEALKRLREMIIQIRDFKS